MGGNTMRTSSYTIFAHIKTIFVFVLIFLIFFGARQAMTQSYQTSKKVEIVIDPGNKQNVTGYVQIAYAWGQLFDPPRDLLRGLRNLKEAMIKYTKINTELEDHLILSSNKLLRMPFVFVTTKIDFDLTEIEKRNIRNYFDNGGFMLLDNAEPRGDFSRGGASLKQMLRDTIPNARFLPIPNSHPIYHCFFDFDDGPPNGAEIGVSGGVMSPQRLYLEGVWYKGRLAAIYSDKGYIIKWNQNSNNEPQLKIGVNIIVFALTQEGGITDIH